MRTLAGYCVIACCCATAAFAQTDAARAGASQPGATRMQLASRLAAILTEYGEQKIDAITDSAQVKDTPQGMLIRRLGAAHVAKYFPVDSVRALAAREYAQSFSEADLHALLAFYESPIGVRFLMEQRRLYLTTQAALRQALHGHQGELDAAMRAALGVPPPAI